ncbi:pirin family protein [Massilia atriviolacea]|uniref:Pirin family protein n=1 Tax=Massilia atriviolacea TaxID=2495579 RepID=A0A430HR10_9BURK|nr:pirin family protein [Massilia atriviolacea]RSZ59955.1 pirin family protein [Massilia atriviolacea]
MSVVHFFKPHEKDIGGGFRVRRVLPAAAKQAVGPFIFFDHFGPIDAPAEANHDVRPHPHIGLATVTYLYEGAMEHRDSVGSVQRIEPGAINWMTAGRGIVHSERTPPDLAGKPRRSHGLQLWAALPRAHEEDAPSFAHTPADAIPVERLDGALVRVLIGSAYGHTSPVATFSETLYLDITLDPGRSIELDNLPQEAAIYPVTGEIAIDGELLAPHTMACLDAGSGASVYAAAGAQFVVIGGAPLDGHRHMVWNFVSSSKERIARAVEDWEQQRFDQVPGETEFIPFPKRQAGTGGQAPLARE